MQREGKNDGRHRPSIVLTSVIDDDDGGLFPVSPGLGYDLGDAAGLITGGDEYQGGPSWGRLRFHYLLFVSGN